MLVLPLLQQAEGLGVSLADLVASWYPQAPRVPMWVETALWAGYAWLYGPGGRQRLGYELSALRLRVHTVMGGKSRLSEHELFPFPSRDLDAAPQSLGARRQREIDRKRAAFHEKFKMLQIMFGEKKAGGSAV